jgi:hypothetical protein
VATDILRRSASTRFSVVTGLPAIRGINYLSHRQGRRRLPEPRGQCQSPVHTPLRSTSFWRPPLAVQQPQFYFDRTFEKYCEWLPVIKGFCSGAGSLPHFHQMRKSPILHLTRGYRSFMIVPNRCLVTGLACLVCLNQEAVSAESQFEEREERDCSNDTLN